MYEYVCHNERVTKSSHFIETPWSSRCLVWRVRNCNIIKTNSTTFPPRKGWTVRPNSLTKKPKKNRRSLRWTQVPNYQQIHVCLSSTCMTKMYPSVPSLSSLIVTIAALSLLLHVTIWPYLTYRSSKSKIWGLPERVGDLAQSAARDFLASAFICS